MTDPLVGMIVSDVREMTDEELAYEGWCTRAVVLVMHDGTRIYASRDSEGNGPGTLFARDSDGNGAYVTARQAPADATASKKSPVNMAGALDTLGRCPGCNVSWDDGPIPAEVREYYSPPYRFSKIIARVDRDLDRTVEYQCPYCDATFDAATGAMLNKGTGTACVKEPPSGRTRDRATT